jgi:hypothetical protein
MTGGPAAATRRCIASGSRAYGRRGLARLVLGLIACAIALPASAGATPSFLSPIDISAAGQDAFEPQVAVDSSGNSLMVWTRYDGANTRIQAQMRASNGSFGPTETISVSGKNASEPQIAFDSSRNAIAVWSRANGANTLIEAAYRPVNGSFGAPQVLSSPGADSPQISIDASGVALAVWERFDGTNFRIEAAIAQSAGNFGSAQPLSDPGQDALIPQVGAGANADSHAAVVWERSDGSKLRIQSSRRRDVPGFPRPRGATPLRAALVPAYNACTSPNRDHGGPLAVMSCNPPVQSSSVLTVGTFDANTFAPNSVSSVRFDVLTGNANNNVDDGDVKVAVSMTDIRNNPSGTDYTGRVLLSVPLQITDKNNAAETPEPGTAQALSLRVPVDCVLTTDTSIGGKCNISTTLDAVVPNTVPEGQRSNWELGQMEVRDAGPNGTGYASCPPTCGDGDEATFMRAGIFVP